MYRILKNIAGKLFSKKFLLRNETLLRKLASPLYLGSRYECSICGACLREFVLTKNEKKCPVCGSLGRDRRLIKIIDGFVFPGARILDFSPSRPVFRSLKRRDDVVYIASDLSGDFLSDEKFDITNISAPSESFDLIVCYHVLEHVERDLDAMEEISRVLSPGGKAIIQTPFKAGEIFEDSTATTPEKRAELFGQDDHVRIYSPQGLRDRMRKTGFAVEIKTFEQKPENRFGYPEKETILIAAKPSKESLN